MTSQTQASANTTKRLNIGVIGIGVGGLEIIRSIVQQDQIVRPAAGCDVVPVTRQRFQERFPEARVYESVDSICKDPELDAVYIASPNRFHAEHAITAARHGKHVLVEKPMAISLREAENMVEECEKAGTLLVCAHTASYGMPFRTMRKVIESGEIGRVRAIHMLSYTDWILRPRTADELDFSQGGGVPFRQGPHQLDTVRLLGGGMLKSVRATVGQWMPERPIPGYYNAHLDFEDGAVATIIHNGYGYFLLSDINGPASGRSSLETRVRTRRAIQQGTRDETADKQDLRLGGASESQQFQRALNSIANSGGVTDAPAQASVDDRSGLNDASDWGTTIVSCERGDMRVDPGGSVYIYDDNGVRTVRGVSDVAARGEVQEMYDAVFKGKPVFHSGRWGMATAQAIFGMVESSSLGKEVVLTHQVPVHPEYDIDLRVVPA